MYPKIDITIVFVKRKCITPSSVILIKKDVSYTGTQNYHISDSVWCSLIFIFSSKPLVHFGGYIIAYHHYVKLPQ